MHNPLYSWSPMNLGNLLTEAGYEVLETGVNIHKWPPGYLTIRKTPRMVGLSCHVQDPWTHRAFLVSIGNHRDTVLKIPSRGPFSKQCDSRREFLGIHGMMDETIPMTHKGLHAQCKDRSLAHSNLNCSTPVMADFRICAGFAWTGNVAVR